MGCLIVQWQANDDLLISKKKEDIIYEKTVKISSSYNGLCVKYFYIGAS